MTSETTTLPAVVAVVVAHDPGPCLERTLEALGAQDYPGLTVAVIDAASQQSLEERVASALPGAFLRRLEENRGFGAAANAIMGMADGADFFLLCHDDVLPDQDALRKMVEEAFRSNAGVVSPKFVAYDEPERLLHVGMAVDKTGAVVDRVEPGEMDRGQHDAVQDVFLATGGMTLVRADLFRALGGFDEAMPAMGEDLDLCWRARILGARVIVAPSARVAHLELTASGKRGLPPAAFTSPGSPGRSKRLISRWRARLADTRKDAALTDLTETQASGAGSPDRAALLQALQRRHEMRAVLKCYEGAELVRILPQMAVLNLAEVIVALLAGHFDRARAVLGAWRWNLAHLGETRRQRAGLASMRVMSDRDVREFQVHGSARLTAYARRAVTHGLHVAHLRELSPLHAASPEDPGREEYVILRVSVWGAAGLLVLFGAHQLLSGPLPVVKDLLPLPSWSALLKDFASGPKGTGAGPRSPGAPGALLLGLAGLVTGGSVGLVDKVLVLGCMPLGAIGAARLARPLGSPRARLVSAVAYLLLPVAYNSLATGSLPGLVAYATAPWLLARLASATGIEPFSSPAQAHGALRLGRLALSLGIVGALAGALAPQVLLLPLVLACGVALGVLLGSTNASSAWRVLATAMAGTLVALLLLAPWSIHLLEGSMRWAILTATRVMPSTAPTWGSLWRLAVGPVGDTPLAWGIPVAAALALIIGSSWRMTWAAACWTGATTCIVLAWLGGRGWLGSFDPPPSVMLAGAGTALCLAIGIGTLSFESDLRAHRFGWRQASTTIAAMGVAAGMLPVLAPVGTGRLDLPPSGYRQALAWLASADGKPGNVLWLGDPRVIPGTALPIRPGLSYSLTRGGVPDATYLWPSSSPGPTAQLASDVDLAYDGQTVRIGKLLSPFHVRYLVVVRSLAPVVPGLQQPPTYDLEGTLTSALRSQTDLRELPGEEGYTVFANLLGAPAPTLLARASKGTPSHRPSGSPGLHALALIGEGAAWLAAVALLISLRRAGP